MPNYIGAAGPVKIDIRDAMSMQETCYVHPCNFTQKSGRAIFPRFPPFRKRPTEASARVDCPKLVAIAPKMTPTMTAETAYCPGFRSLYWADFPLRRTMRAMCMGGLVAIGGGWMLQPVPNALPQYEPPIEVQFAPWMIVGGIAVAILSAVFVLLRYRWIRQVLLHGESIQGTADLLDIYDTNMHGSSDRIRKTPTYAYYVNIRYEWRGLERTVRFKLLHSPSTFGIRKGQPVELLVLDSAPHKPLIRSVYLHP